ncbi:MAG: hypothetical protein E6G00_06300 [Actinobacteria bacterium]|nr:MAG: hypothetical protein E6G00_06300 [Actinomycetota bacterium]
MSDAEILARAKAYPFTRPGASVVILGDRLLEVVELDPDDLASSLVRQGDSEIALGDAAGDAGAPLDELAAVRTAVLAFGSNASPDTLRWKFPDHVAVLPLLHGRASGVDVVYSAHMTVYGSIPGTLQTSPGTTVEVYVALLTEAQLERMAAWEINATLERLDGLALELERADPPERVAAFISKHGCLTAGGAEIAIAEVAANRRRFHAMTQPGVLEHARELAAPDLSLDEFVLAGVRDYERARAYTETLKRTARPFVDPRQGVPGSRRGDSNP